nr:methyltransferase domain-containing protein [Paenibacillus sacheonensis]
MFRCPLCYKTMAIIHFQSLVCGNGHCFDIAKHGYVHLLSNGSRTKYDQTIFAHRRLICKSGLFDPLYAAISGIIWSRHPHDEPIRILDAGCGEGSHLSNLQNRINRIKPQAVVAVGVDISKEAISYAAAGYSDAIWCVADIANCPFSSRQFQFILNILSPANYSEFGRLAADKGLVIKVVPGQGYLQEIREILYQGSGKQTYSNSRTRSRFNKQFHPLDVVSLRYQVDLREGLIEPLLGMTPLSWGTSRERIEQVLRPGLNKVTMDFDILIGSARDERWD